MPRGYPNKPNNSRGWGDMTAEERSQEMRRRLDVGRARKRRGPATTIEPTTSNNVTLRELVDSLEQSAANFNRAVEELKSKVFG